MDKMDKGSKDSANITRLPNGGYVVSDGMFRDDCRSQLGAFSTIEEALEFVKFVIEPAKPQQGKMKDILYGNPDKGFGGTLPA